MEQLTLIAGVDEVGRGPLAGPVVAAAVILDPNKPIEGLADSKKLSEKKRETLMHEILQNAHWGLGFVDERKIDELNILNASILAMQLAVTELDLQPDHVLVDGNVCPDFPCTAEAIIKGDATEPAIQAASILAKVTRDNIMCFFDLKYPEYGFAQHKGYPTKQHRLALLEYGITPLHRLSYKPVRDALNRATINPTETVQ